MLHGPAEPEHGVHIGECVEGVRIRGEQPGKLVLAEGGQVLLTQGVEQARLSYQPGALPGALLLVAENGEVHTQGAEHPGRRPGVVLAARVIRRIALDDPQHVDRTPQVPQQRHRNGGALHPGRPLARRLSHRVAVAQGVGEGALQLRRHLGKPEQHLLLDQGQEHIGEAQATWALGPAVVAGDTAEQVVAGDDLLDEALAQHADEAARRVAHHIPVRACPGTGAALDTAEQLPSRR